MLKLKKVEGALLFLTILFLPTQLGKHFWPQFSYIYSLKVDYLSPTLYFWDVLVVGLVTIWFLRKPHINKVALNLLLFFLFTQGLSLTGAENIGAGLVRLEQYVLAGFFGLYLASLTDLKAIYRPLFFSIIGESVLSILQFTIGSTLGLWILGERTFSLSTPGIAKFDFHGVQFLRPYATFPHPNVLAGFMLITVLASLREAKRLMLWIVALMGGIAIFLTMSRTVILAGVVPLILVARKKWAVGMVLIFAAISPILFTRFSSLLNYDNLTLLRREELIGNSTQLFLKDPVFGVGLNNFIPAIAGNLVSGPNRFLQPVHNIFLLALSETGTIGLLGLVCLIGYPMKRIFNSQFSVYKLLPWLAVVFLGMFDHYILTLPQGYRLLFLIWGLSMSARYRSKS